MDSRDKPPPVDYPGSPAYLHTAHDRWLRSSGNENVVSRCLDMLLADRDPRVILIAGEPGSGLSSVLSEVARRLRRNKSRVIALREDDDSDPCFVLQGIVEVLQMPNAIRNDISWKMPPVFESVLVLRGYRYFLIHDAGRFLMFSRLTVRGTRNALAYLLSLPMRAKLVIAGTSDDISKYRQLLESFQPECLRLTAMINDERYALFVAGLVLQNLSGRASFVPDVDAIHYKTRGLVGETATEVFEQCHAHG